MTNEVTTRIDPPHDDGGSGGKVDAAKGVAERTAGRAGEVAGEARSQVETVAREAKVQARDLFERGRHDLDDEAAARSRQAAGSVRVLADRMGALANGDPAGAGPLADLLQEGQQRLQLFAQRLDDGPAAVLDDLRRFARRQPVLFLAAAGGLGFLTGRLVRAGRASSSDDARSADVTEPFVATMSRPAGGELAPPSTITDPPLVDTPTPSVAP